MDRNWTDSPSRPLRVVLAAVVWMEALAFAFAAFLHSGTRLAFLPSFFQDPRIVSATVVEGLCAVALAAAAIQITMTAPWAWRMAVGAQIVCICADIFGMIVIALGFGPDSAFNFLFHRVGIAILVMVLAGFLTTPARNALSRPATA